MRKKFGACLRLNENDAAFWAWNAVLPVALEGAGPLNDNTPPAVPHVHLPYKKA